MRQKLPTRIVWMMAALALISSLPGCSSRTHPAQPAPANRGPSANHVNFVVWTDPHVFDAGKGRHGEGVWEEELDDWAALHWAVIETNRLVLAEHRAIDFVAITGDFGLQNVQLPDGPIPEKKVCECPYRSRGEEGPIDYVPLAEAAASIARELSALVVKRVYLVPGNNDLCGEDPNDLHRWAEFVLALQDELERQHRTREVSLKESSKGPGKVEAPAKPEVVDLTETIPRLYARQDARIVAFFSNGRRSKPVLEGPPVINGIHLLGMDTAFFKSHDNAKTQSVADAAITKEIDFVSKRIQSGGSYLLFTHIADLNDPYIASLGKNQPSWKLPKAARKQWEREVLSRTEVLGVFAGHFHVANRDIYPHTFTYAKPDETTGAKLWLVPPLAEKYQWRSPAEKTARGMLLVSANGNGDIRVSMEEGERVQASAIWFSTLDQKAAIVGDDKLALARTAELDGRWDDAAKSYQDALGVAGTDGRTRGTALSGYLRAREKMRSWWWQSPVARWLYLYVGPLLVSAAVILAFVLGYALLRGMWAVKGLMGLLKLLIIPSFRGRAVISDTVQLTTDAPVKEFSALLQAEGEEIKRRLEREKENWAAGHITLLAPAATSLDSLVNSIPKVQTLNVSDWLKFLVNIAQTFRWSVQTGLAVFAPNQAGASAPPSTGSDKAVVLVSGSELNAYAALQWGCIVKISWRRTREVGSDRTALRDLARELAELILGQAFV